MPSFARTSMHTAKSTLMTKKRSWIPTSSNSPRVCTNSSKVGRTFLQSMFQLVTHPSFPLKCQCLFCASQSDGWVERKFPPLVVSLDREYNNAGGTLSRDVSVKRKGSQAPGACYFLLYLSESNKISLCCLSGSLWRSFPLISLMIKGSPVPSQFLSQGLWSTSWGELPS